MEFGVRRLNNPAETIKAANQPKLRLFLLPKKTATTPQVECEGKWAVCTPDSIIQYGWSGFSAVGYFFGKEIHETRHVPVGLIETAWGGTPAQSWTSLEALDANPALKYYADKVTTNIKNTAQLKEKFEQETLPQWQKEQDAWQAQYGAAHDAVMARWKKDVEQARAALQAAPPEPVAAKPAPRKPVFFTDSPYTPATLFNAMIHPLLPFGIKGVIWYQGEANGGKVDTAREYATLFPAMIADWRQRWKVGDFPFLFVQLAGFAAGTAYPELRDSQTSTLSVPNTGMAVAIDVGEANDIHPKNKAAVAHRLALAARHVAYGENVVDCGPMYAGMKADGSSVRVSFSHAEGRLVAGSPSTAGTKGSEEKPTGQLEGFEVAGTDGKFVRADARIDGTAVMATAAEVPAPTAVRYGWKGFTEANLYNQAGLPASPFNSLSTRALPDEHGHP